MPLDADHDLPEDWQVEALLAYDEALAAGRAPSPRVEPDSLLQAVNDCQALLERVWPRSTSDSLALPRQFGRFQIERELGRGGFGIVYLATDTALKRQVALKVPRPGVVLTPEFHRRFLREGEAASRLDHPHIVPIFETGEQGTLCYIASAYCDGYTVAEWLGDRSAPVPPRLAAELLVKLALAVGHAHERGILHRDLKPKNIMLQGSRGKAANHDEPELVPRICDFGLAKILDEDGDDTCTGVPIGSPAYMAPEQASGRHRDICPATDVYALGVMLYQILVGRTPFQGETALETLRHISDIEPPAPRTLRPGLSRDLDTICMKCLEKRPDRRYATGSELAEDLGRFVSGRPVKARPVSGWVRAEKWVRRSPVSAALSGVIAVAILGVIVGLAWAGARERDHNATLLGALDRTSASEQLAHRLWASGQIRLAQFHHDLGNVETASEILDDIRLETRHPEPHGFAWSYLDRLCRTQLPRSVKLSFRTTACAPAPDGLSVALGDDQGDLWVWDMVQGTVTPLKSPRHGSIISLAFSPDGRTLASSSDYVIKLFNIATYEQWPGEPLIAEPADWLFFGRDGETLTSVRMATEAERSSVRVWRVAARERRAILEARPAHDRPSTLLLPGKPSIDNEAGARILSDVAVAAEGRTLAIRDPNGTIEIHDTNGGGKLASCRRDGDEVVFVALSQVNAPMPTAEVDRIRGLIQQLTGSKRLRRACADRAVRDATFSPDGSELAIYASKTDRNFGEFSVFDTASGRLRASYTLSELTSTLLLVRFTTRGRLLVIRSDSPKALLWQWEDRADPPAPAGHEEEVWGLAYSPDGRVLASSSDDWTIKLWDAATGSLFRTLEGHGSLVSSVVFSPDGTLLASAGFDDKVMLWEVATGKRLAALEGHTGHLRCVAFSPDGKMLSSAGNDGTVRLWDVSTRSARGKALKAHDLMVHSVAFSPDGRFLCSGGDDRKVCVWDASSGRLLREFPSGNIIQALAFSPDGSTLAAASVDGSITLRDMVTGTPRTRLRGHSLEVLGLAFSPDGRTLASAGRDMTVRLWDPATGQEQLTLKGHKHRVHAVAFSPDGSTLASGSFDGLIKLWRSGEGPD